MFQTIVVLISTLIFDFLVSGSVKALTEVQFYASPFVATEKLRFIRGVLHFKMRKPDE